LSDSRIFRKSNGSVEYLVPFFLIKLSFIIIAKIHCIPDIDSIDKEQHNDSLPFGIIPRHTEITIQDAIAGNNEAFVKDMVSFAMVSWF